MGCYSDCQLTIFNHPEIRVYSLVLEERETKITSAANLNALGRARGTLRGANRVRVARRRRAASKLRLLGWAVVPGRLLVGGGAQGGEDEVAVAGDVVAGGLELGLLGEEEDGAAGFARVAVGDVEVEDCAFVGGDGCYGREKC